MYMDYILESALGIWICCLTLLMFRVFLSSHTRDCKFMAL